MLLQKQQHYLKKLIIKVHEIYSKSAATMFYGLHLGRFSLNFMKNSKALFLKSTSAGLLVIFTTLQYHGENETRVLAS